MLSPFDPVLLGFSSAEFIAGGCALLLLSLAIYRKVRYGYYDWFCIYACFLWIITLSYFLFVF